MSTLLRTIPHLPTATPKTSLLPSSRAAAAILPSTRRLLSSSPIHNNNNNNKTETPPPTLLSDPTNGFGHIRHNPRPPKPRTTGVTEIRGPYYSAMGPSYLSDVLHTMGHHVDGLKFAGGSFALFPERALRELLDLAHAHGVYVSTGGWIEHVLASSGGNVGPAIDKYLEKCKDLGFDVVEVSTGFLSLPEADWLRLVERVHEYGLKAKPELGIQFGAGGDTEKAGLEALGSQADPGRVARLAGEFVKMGVERCMVESEGITENVGGAWRTDVIQAILREVPVEKLMFEAADPQVFNWYIREFGVDVNLFVDHSQIVQLSCLRQGIWGMADTFGKITTYRP